MTTTPTTDLLHIEAIKQLKARYFRAMDSKHWDELAACFSADLIADFREAPGMLAEGRDNYVTSLRDILGSATTVHHGHMPEITLVDELHAHGIWAMDDIVELPDFSLRGWGHYHEQYRCESGEWKITHIRLTRLRLIINGEEQAVQATHQTGVL